MTYVQGRPNSFSHQHAYVEGGSLFCSCFPNARPPFNCIHEDADAAPDSTSSSIDLMDRILLSRFARVDDKLKLEILARAV